MDSLVAQIHTYLADAIRRQQPRPFETPVTVAEIYQDLVPYRNVRELIGFEMNADYEHTLLRLLAGEGEFARLEPVEAREELRIELASANPNVGLFRKFAACDVWITPGGSERAADVEVDSAFDAWEDRSALWRNAGEPVPEAGGVEPESDPLELLLDEEVEPGTQLEPEAIIEPVAPDANPWKEEIRVPPATSASESRADGARCVFCDSTLPQGRVARFCPYCGANQAQVPCPACGEALEREWAYCLACGAAAHAET